MQKLSINISDIENACEELAMGADSYDFQFCSALNRRTGEISHMDPDGGDPEEFLDDEDLIELPNDLASEDGYRTMAQFVASLDPGEQRDQLEHAISGKGAFRRFKDIVFGGGDVELKYAWNWFEKCQLRQRITDWLNSEGIDPGWGDDIFEQPELPSKRPELLEAVLNFTRQAAKLDGVRRIALLGSLTTDKRIPKDVDLLVEISDEMPLDQLARHSRQLLSEAMQTGDSCGADVFLCNPAGNYLGRVCGWKRCEPFVRQRCEAQHCGARQFLYDDLQNVRLGKSLIATPPLELWPKVIARVELPEDVRSILIEALDKMGD